MAISSFDRARLVRSARAIIAANYGQIAARGGSPSVALASVGVYQRLRSLQPYSGWSGLTAQIVTGAVRSAGNGIRAAQTMSANPAVALGNGALPVVASLVPTSDRYQYSAIVRASDAYGNTTERPLTVTSAVPMSAQEVEAYIRANNPGQGSPFGATQRPLSGLGSTGAVTDVLLIGASRTR